MNKIIFQPVPVNFAEMDVEWGKFRKDILLAKD